MKKYTYNLAPAFPSENGDTNEDRMNRWERANGMKMSELTEEEWLDVTEKILCLTPQEARDYLNFLLSRSF
jgi:hypothetical protein